MNGIQHALVFIFLILNVPLFAAETNQWSVQVTSLQILAPGMETSTNFSEKYKHSLAKLRAQHGGMIPGVTVSFCVTAPNGEIADVNDDAGWSLDSVTDDKGKNLLAAVPWEKYYSSAEYGRYQWGYTDGGPSLFLDIKAPGLPSKGATALNITGKISVRTATGSEQLVAENVKLKTGVEFNLGNIKLTVSDAQMDDGKFSLQLEGKQDSPSISNLEFFDSRGNEIKPLDSGKEGMAEKGKMLLTDWDYTFPKRLKSVKIIATHWVGFTNTEVPIHIKTGLGL